jgi:hypothetical protein
MSAFDTVKDEKTLAFPPPLVVAVVVVVYSLVSTGTPRRNGEKPFFAHRAIPPLPPWFEKRIP